MSSESRILVGIIGTVGIQLAMSLILRLRHRSRKPRGSIAIDKALTSDKILVPGNAIVKLIIVAGFAVYAIVFVSIFASCITNSWEGSVLYAGAFKLPVWVNWLGVAGLWFFGFWKSALLAYNINFTLFFLPMKDGYTLATGGPYRFVRHPAYAGWLMLIPSLFMMTGVLLLLVGLVVWPLCIYQAREEEKALREMFGEAYDDYASRTGMFFPKLAGR